MPAEEKQENTLYPFEMHEVWGSAECKSECFFPGTEVATFYQSLFWYCQPSMAISPLQPLQLCDQCGVSKSSLICFGGKLDGLTQPIF